MNKTAIVIGILLIAIGLAGYYGAARKVVDTVSGETVEVQRSVTALIPAFVGAPMVLCGLWSLVQPSMNQHAMHLAALIALLGALAATGRALQSLVQFVRAEGDFNARAFGLLSLMGVLCWMFVIYGIQSFRRAKRAKNTAV